jgi:hypothetical protein
MILMRVDIAVASAHDQVGFAALTEATPREAAESRLDHRLVLHWPL